MLTRTLAASAGLMLAASASATTMIAVTGIDATQPVASAPRNYAADLAGLGLTRFTTVFDAITLNGPARVTFSALGGESAFFNLFRVGAVDGAQFVQGLDRVSGRSAFQAPGTSVLGTIDLARGQSLGTMSFQAFRDMNMRNAVSSTQRMTSGNLAVYLPGNVTGTLRTSQLVIGYDDPGIGGRADRDFDDYLIGVSVSAVPEPETWAMLILGFGLVGFAMRRRATRGSLRTVTA